MRGRITNMNAFILPLGTMRPLQRRGCSDGGDMVKQQVIHHQISRCNTRMISWTTSSSFTSTSTSTSISPSPIMISPTSSSFITNAAAHTQRRMPAATATISAQLGSPSIQVGRPKTSIKKDIGRVTQEPDAPQADAEKGSAKARPRRKTQADEVPLYKVILLGDETYVEAHVVTQIQKTVQLDKGEATRIFREAQASGSSVVCVVCEEHAEFYAQQLKRQDIFVVVEKDE